MEGGEGIKNHVKFADVLMDGPQHLWIEGPYLNRKKLVTYTKTKLGETWLHTAQKRTKF